MTKSIIYKRIMENAETLTNKKQVLMELINCSQIKVVTIKVKKEKRNKQEKMKTLTKKKECLTELIYYSQNLMEGAKRIFKYRKITFNGSGVIFYQDPLFTDESSCLTGLLYGKWSGGKTPEVPHTKTDKPYYRNCSSGIEVLCMKPQRTKDGKYKYDGISKDELVLSCKHNGINGYSKHDKAGVVSLLLNL